MEATNATIAMPSDSQRAMLARESPTSITSTPPRTGSQVRKLSKGRFIVSVPLSAAQACDSIHASMAARPMIIANA